MEKRLELFLKSVTDYADKQCVKLQKTAETRMQKEITAYKKQATEQSRNNTNREIEKIQSDAANRASSYECGKRLELSRLRNELSSGIFADVEEKIKAFTESDDYPVFLGKSAENLVSVIGKSIIFHIRPCDMNYKDILRQASADAVICPDEKIKLGGIIATDKNEELRADDTLDSRFEAEKTSFFENSEIKVF